MIINITVKITIKKFILNGIDGSVDFNNELYSNIALLMKPLNEQQFTLVVATSKPIVFTEQILKYFNIDQYFELIVGNNFDGTIASKTETIQYILDKYKEHHLNVNYFFRNRNLCLVTTRKFTPKVVDSSQEKES